MSMSNSRRIQFYITRIIFVSACWNSENIRQNKKPVHGLYIIVLSFFLLAVVKTCADNSLPRDVFIGLSSIGLIYVLSYYVIWYVKVNKQYKKLTKTWQAGLSDNKLIICSGNDTTEIGIDNTNYTWYKTMLSFLGISGANELIILPRRYFDNTDVAAFIEKKFFWHSHD